MASCMELLNHPLRGPGEFIFHGAIPNWIAQQHSKLQDHWTAQQVIFDHGVGTRVIVFLDEPTGVT